MTILNPRNPTWLEKYSIWILLIVAFLIGEAAAIGVGVSSKNRIEHDPLGGMILFTDKITGCEYLQTPGLLSGSLTPRLNGQGKQMGCNN